MLISVMIEIFKVYFGPTLIYKCKGNSFLLSYSFFHLQLRMYWFEWVHLALVLSFNVLSSHSIIFVGKNKYVVLVDSKICVGSS